MCEGEGFKRILDEAMLVSNSKIVHGGTEQEWLLYLVKCERELAELKLKEKLK